ncbi:MAG TPA: hypothetical protein VFA33_10240 [Bryobacteraceae bacterium]|nr:hypothetical protein [Bryobacteraceae bacterium]
MPKQELDLIRFAAGQVAEPRASAPKIIWGELLDSCTRGALADDLPRTFGVIPLPQTFPALLIDRKSVPSVMALASFHASTAALTHPARSVSVRHGAIEREARF